METEAKERQDEFVEEFASDDAVRWRASTFSAESEARFRQVFGVTRRELEERGEDREAFMARRLPKVLDRLPYKSAELELVIETHRFWQTSGRLRSALLLSFGALIAATVFHSDVLFDAVAGIALTIALAVLVLDVGNYFRLRQLKRRR